MATGIISVSMRGAGQSVLSCGLLVLTAGSWAVLGGAFVARQARAPHRWQREAARPMSLSAVAATTVLGVRLTELGWAWAGWALLAIAAVLCLGLGALLTRTRSLPTAGVSFLIVVAPESVAILATAFGSRRGLDAAGVAGLALSGFGLGLYPLVLTRFDFGELRSGCGDRWVAGGALAIAALVCANIGEAASVSPATAGLHSVLRIAGLVLWAAAMAWLPVLIVAEVSWRRPGYDVHRWATVFPLGMYAAMTAAVGRLVGTPLQITLGHGLAWVAFAVWTATALGFVRHVARRASRPVGHHIVVR
jgi:tellurite resistance protein TehA-like permease